MLNQSEVTLNVISGRVIGFPVPGSDAPTALTFIPGDVLYINEIKKSRNSSSYFAKVKLFSGINGKKPLSKEIWVSLSSKNLEIHPDWHFIDDNGEEVYVF